jgi:glycopeptide antibiotics resistance protein
MLLRGRIARAIRWSGAFAFGLVFSIGLIVSATLTPSHNALFFELRGSGQCDLSHLVPTSLRELRPFGEVGLNVLLFTPLGFVVGWSARRRQLLLFAALAIPIPFAIEWIQLVLTSLDRACQGSDVVDNLAGLAIGCAVGLATTSLIRIAFRRESNGRRRGSGTAADGEDQRPAM